MIKVFLTTAISLFLMSSLFAQRTSSTTKSNTYSINFDTDDKADNSSVSIKRNDDIYKFSARFHESKTGNIKKMLVDKLGDTGLTIFGDVYRWIKNENGDKLYDCKLTDNTLKIYVDKEFANSNTVVMMEELGASLKEAISGTDSKEEGKKDAERAFKIAERELEKAKKELEKAKRRLKNNN
ncbi:hypothetical protein CW731_07400 [Polaribacter sp. ALD11]|uniref:hypothetical protein n=1 Tax=Polaribacter sp. ALD11 TaxID=2058137 RepID=UPI000C313637|nr:hypothetical protein [Polaribacter sp. ALD11]AUC85128.1 hypothetical protein CW731_07400 [Polaribacter sp. ALD11]